MPVKGVIVAAGYGTRFLPVTRCVPKEMLPLVDRPAIDFIAAEFEEAGIEDVLIITSRRKKALEDWFDRDPELEAVFTAEKAWHKLDKSRPRNLRVHFVRQPQMAGTGDALLRAAAFAGSDPVVVAFPDDLFGNPNATSQLIDAWKETGCSVLAAQDLTGHDVSRYGVLDCVEEGEHLRVRGVVEKPAPGTEPSHYVSLGRYLYTPEFFPLLAEFKKSHGQGEYYPMQAIDKMAAQNTVVGTVLDAPRRDTGAPLGYMQACIDEALSRPDLAGPLAEWLRVRLAQ
ncbi:MAG: UTP--glucose-1-phosphate uridylyltransferase [Kiritimatiellia bacterium]|jgi:UTP--glucose-1-phosphate uridylyltransferase